jgi:hypothetical protein
MPGIVRQACWNDEPGIRGRDSQLLLSRKVIGNTALFVHDYRGTKALSYYVPRYIFQGSEHRGIWARFKGRVVAHRLQRLAQMMTSVNRYRRFEMKVGAYCGDGDYGDCHVVWWSECWVAESVLQLSGEECFSRV